MRMRYVLICALAFGCSDAAAIEFEATEETSPGGLLAASDPVPEAEPEPELCFQIQDQVREQFPSIEAEATTAAAAWGLPFRADADCINWMTIEADELFENPSLTAQMRRHTDGYRVLRFRESALPTISDTTATCGTMDVDGAVVFQVPMLAILLHEFGHALGLKHTTEGLMSDRRKASCDVVWPSEDDLAAAEAARHTPQPQP